MKNRCLLLDQQYAVLHPCFGTRSTVASLIGLAVCQVMITCLSRTMIPNVGSCFHETIVLRIEESFVYNTDAHEQLSNDCCGAAVSGQQKIL